MSDAFTPARNAWVGLDKERHLGRGCGTQMKSQLSIPLVPPVSRVCWGPHHVNGPPSLAPDFLILLFAPQSHDGSFTNIPTFSR